MGYFTLLLEDKQLFPNGIHSMPVTFRIQGTFRSAVDWQVTDLEAPRLLPDGSEGGWSILPRGHHWSALHDIVMREETQLRIEALILDALAEAGARVRGNDEHRLDRVHLLGRAA